MICNYSTATEDPYYRVHARLVIIKGWMCGADMEPFWESYSTHRAVQSSYWKEAAILSI